RREAWPAGLLAGLFGGLAAMAGPPAVAYFLRRGTAPATARASLMCFFFATSLMALPGMGMAGLVDRPTVLLSVLCLPMLLGGTWLGGRIFARTSEAGYRRLAIAVLAAMAAASAARGAAGLWL
ncbi:MAG: TSUP family transporter, partial [Pseudomonadota bacterium]|nr:TSUP family transporter [Pseudomonadota bacterium]